LKKSDPILRSTIDQIGPCSLKPSKDYFGSLVRTIISQQLSTRAADTILERFGLELKGAISPKSVLALSSTQFRKAGISKQKKSYLLELASKFDKGEIDAGSFRNWEDERLIAYLVSIRGIGRWSAEMFLIFCLNRLNVLPLDDVGFKRAVRVNYGLGEGPSERTLKRISKQWEPYRSIAVWYLWQSIDGIG